VFVGLNACQVLDQINSGQGFNPGRNVSARNQCTASKPDFGSNSLALDSVQGLSEFSNTDPGAVKITINGRNAMQAQDGIGNGCAVAIEVGEHARALVDVGMSRASDDAQACPNAKALAEKVEPLLPKVQ
jgi:hypothetical protein